MSERWRLTQGL